MTVFPLECSTLVVEHRLLLISMCIVLVLFSTRRLILSWPISAQKGIIAYIKVTIVVYYYCMHANDQELLDFSPKKDLDCNMRQGLVVTFVLDRFIGAKIPTSSVSSNLLLMLLLVL